MLTSLDMRLVEARILTDVSHDILRDRFVPLGRGQSGIVAMTQSGSRITNTTTIAYDTTIYGQDADGILTDHGMNDRWLDPSARADISSIVGGERGRHATLFEATSNLWTPDNKTLRFKAVYFRDFTFIAAADLADFAAMAAKASRDLQTHLALVVIPPGSSRHDVLAMHQQFDALPAFLAAAFDLHIQGVTLTTRS